MFRHPAGVFFERGIVPDTEGRLECSSLSVESCKGSSLVVAVMHLPSLDMDALARREEEYELVSTPYHALDSGAGDEPLGRGLLCMPLASDEDFVKTWGHERYEVAYGRHGIKMIWGWGPDSGILPCPVYLRHCVLAAQKAGEVAYASFLDDSVLVNRRTTVRKYLVQRPDIMSTLPPESLRERYNG